MVNEGGKTKTKKPTTFNSTEGFFGFNNCNSMKWDLSQWALVLVETTLCVYQLWG